MSGRPVPSILVVCVAAVAGCGSTTTTTTHSTPPREQLRWRSTKVDPACETVREELRSEEGPKPADGGRYLAEDKEMVQEECGAAARKRYAKVQSESPRESQCKVARKLLSEAEANDIPSYIREGKEMVSASCGE